MDGQRREIIIDGTVLVYSDERNVLEICNRNGIKIPQLCYNKSLTKSGHCGLCTVELKLRDVANDTWVPLLACELPPEDGMEIRTSSEVVGAIREMAAKLLLRSHPCDCELCEKFGNCSLRKFYNQTRFGFTRKIEDGKYCNIKLNRLSGRLLIDREKCINCGLCVNFCREVIDEDFLHMVPNSNGLMRLEVYPKVYYKEGYLLNLLEVCPVNAIFDEQVLGQDPSWGLKQVNGISSESSKGNNIKILVKDNFIQRIIPRPNKKIGSIIPDFVRDSYVTNLKCRCNNFKIKGEIVSESNAIIEFSKLIGTGRRCAIVACGSLSLEDFLLARQLADLLGAKIFIKRKPIPSDRIQISGDKNCNIRGALIVRALESRCVDDFSQIEGMIEKRQINTLLVLGEDVIAEGFDKDIFYSIDSIVLSAFENGTTELSKVTIPITTLFECDGHFISEGFILQRFNRALMLDGLAKPMWQWLSMIKNIYTSKTRNDTEFTQIDQIWKFLTKNFQEFRDVNFEHLSEDGQILSSEQFERYEYFD